MMMIISIFVFINCLDPNVRTACLTCVGSIVGIKPPLMEISQLIKPPRPPVGVGRKLNPGDSPLLRPEDAAFLLYPVYTAPKVPSVAEENDRERKEEGKEAVSKGEEQSSIENLSSSIDCIKSNDARANGGDGRDTNHSKKEKKGLSTPTKNTDNCNSGAFSDFRDAKIHSTLIKSEEPNTKASTPSNNDRDDTDSDRIQESFGHPSISSSLTDSMKGLLVKDEDDATSKRHRNVSVCDGADLLGSSGVGDGTDSTGSPYFGSDTPLFTDQLLQAHARETSWVIKLCYKSVQGQSFFSISFLIHLEK